MDLAVAREKKLFKINMTIAVIFWLAIIAGTFGIALIYVALAYLFFLFTQSGLIAFLKGNTVEITAEQFPDLHAKLIKACEKLQMNVPKAYLMNGNGVMNAFATKFLRQHYVVLLSDVIDAIEDSPKSIDFYIGHELGHVKRQHLIYWPIFLPLYIFPLLMPAYRRACELSCDQFGIYCCDSQEDAVRGMALLATGSKRWKTIQPQKYIDQVQETGGFWMSFHEITAPYPWLSKRLAILQNGLQTEKTFPKRHPASWLVGIFCPGFLPGSFLPIIILYVGIIAGVAIPAYMVKKAKSDAANAEQKVEEAMAKVNSANAGILEPNEWQHPITQQIMTLPEGYTNIAGAEIADPVVGAFSTDTDLTAEYLLRETMPQAYKFDDYIELLRKSKASQLPDAKIPTAKKRKIKDVEVAEFSFNMQSAGINFRTTVRAWTFDNLHFWHTVTTVKEDYAKGHEDAERFAQFVVPASSEL